MPASSTRATLTATSNNDLNVRLTPDVTSRKRKREHVEHELDQELSTTKTFNGIDISSPAAVSSHTFSHIVSLSRACFPLAWLNPNVASGSIKAGSILEANIGDWEKNNPYVHIARLCPNGGLYAFEEITGNRHIVWPLQKWATEEWCRNAKEGRISRVDLDVLILKQRGHTRTASTASINERQPTPSSPKQPQNRRGALARMSILTPKNSGSCVTPSDLTRSSIDLPLELLDSNTIYVPTNAIPVTPSTLADERGPSEVHSPPQVHSVVLEGTHASKGFTEHSRNEHESRPDQVSFEQVRQNYLETLYCSKTSLAFYAKGPLKRARTQSQGPMHETSKTGLSEIYRQCILPSKKLDVKYKESLPKITQSFAALNQDGPIGIGETNKGRAVKKVKLSKDGLWNDEHIWIKKWWHERDIGSTFPDPTDARGQECIKAIADLRSRETEMQLLLILEVLLLENAPTKPLQSTVTQEIKTETEHDDATAVIAQIPAAKKKRDLSSEMETIMDKLCIWYAVGLDDLLASPEQGEKQNSAVTTTSKDKLRDFCANVVIPFYAMRLRDECRLICHKLGGLDMSPNKPGHSAMKTKTQSRTAAPVKSRSRLTEKRSLERVLSEDQSMRHASPAVLLRAATAPLVPSLKRERSDSVLSQQRPMSRGGIHKSVSFNNREIDLVADAKAQQSKLKKLDKLATQKRQLEEAISSLRKPHRSSLANAFMDEVEQRTVNNKSSNKDSVQITATPGKAKTSRIIRHSEPKLPPLPAQPVSQDEDNPIIPSSTTKHQLAYDTLSQPRSSTAKRTVLSAIHVTPSRDAVSRISIPLNLPLLHSESIITATPSASRLRRDLPSTSSPFSTTTAGLRTPLRMSQSQKPVLFTQLPKSGVLIENAFRDAPIIPEEAGKAMDRVMGGKSMGLDDGFGPTLQVKGSSGIICKSPDFRSLPNANELPNQISKTIKETREEKSIYDQLGWNTYDVDDDDEL